jgi:Amt family ammonium transporter
MVAYAKVKLGYDDSLDVFGIHGVAGIIGTILTGILATPTVQAAYSGAIYGNMYQLTVQLTGVAATIAYSAIGTALLFWITDKVVGMRAEDKQEALGLDESQHGETAYTTFD